MKITFDLDDIQALLIAEDYQVAFFLAAKIMSRVPDSNDKWAESNTARAFVLPVISARFLMWSGKRNYTFAIEIFDTYKNLFLEFGSLQKSTEALCILCLNNIVKSDNWRKLFWAAGVKTKHVSDRREFKPK